MNNSITLDRKQAPVSQLSAPDEHLMLDTGSFVLNNGMKVYTLPQQGAGICRLDIIIPAGVKYQHHPLTAFFTARMLKEGTARHSGEEIAELLDYYGSFLETNAERDRACISLFAPKKFLGELLPLVREVWEEATFPAAVLEVELRHQKQEFMVNSMRVAWIARQQFNPLVFGPDHPYGKFAEQGDYDKLDQEHLVEHHRRCYFDQATYAILSGDVDATTQNLVREYLGGIKLKGSSQEFQPMPSALAAENRYQFIHRPNALQSAMRIGRVAIARTHPDFMGLQFVVTLLGGYFGSRLMKNIREDKGYTYGIGAFIQPFESAAIFVISTEVGKAVAQASYDEVMKELKALRSHRPGELEMNHVRNYLLGSIQRALDGALPRAERLRGVVESGDHADYYIRLKKNILDISATEVMGLAEKYLHESTMTVLVAGNDDLKVEKEGK